LRSNLHSGFGSWTRVSINSNPTSFTQASISDGRKNLLSMLTGFSHQSSICLTCSPMWNDCYDLVFYPRGFGCTQFAWH
jgi:hypothetical protein